MATLVTGETNALPFARSARFARARGTTAFPRDRASAGRARGGGLRADGHHREFADDIRPVAVDCGRSQGYRAFRLSALNAISQLKAALGSLDRVRRIVRLEGTLGCAPSFTEQPSVIDGASDIVNQIFGPRGLHT